MLPQILQDAYYYYLYLTDEETKALVPKVTHLAESRFKLRSK